MLDCLEVRCYGGHPVGTEISERTKTDSSTPSAGAFGVVEWRQIQSSSPHPCLYEIRRRQAASYESCGERPERAACDAGSIRVGSTELSRAARMNTPSPPKCLSTEIKDVTGSIIRLDQPSFDWLSIALGWLTSHFGGVSKGFSPAPPHLLLEYKK